MSSTSRSPGDKPEGDEPQSKRPASPGRYSLSTEGSTEMAAVRIDSTRMVAVRPESMPGVVPPLAGVPAPPPSSQPTGAGVNAGADGTAAPKRGTLPRGMEAVVPPPAPAPRAAPSVPRATMKLTSDATKATAPTPAGPPVRPGPLAAPPPLPVRAQPQPASPPPAPPPPAAPVTSVSAPPPPSKGTGAAALAGAATPLSSPPPSLRPARLTPPPQSKGSWLPPPPPPKRDSLRPPGSMRPPGTTASTFPGFDEGSIAFAFDALLSEGTTGVEGQAAVDLAPVRELFAELAANHMRHVRDFMIDVKWGEAPREWIEICIPAVTSLRRAAERLELGELAPALDAFGEELKLTVGESSRTIDGSTKDRLLAGYDKLVDILPQAFALDRDTSRREAVIIQSLCLSVPDVRKVTIDKLHAAGLTSLKTLFDAKADEISQVAGIPESLAMRIVERFQEYRRELQNASPQDARAAERERLTTLTAQLLEQHDGYEEAARGWSPEAKAKKRDLFRAREETWLAISLLLARFGEVERLQGIEKVPYGQRITQLTEYLEEARDMYRS